MLITKDTDSGNPSGLMEGDVAAVMASVAKIEILMFAGPTPFDPTGISFGFA
jgi:hypothetical protein